MAKTITPNQLLGEIGETAVRLRFLNMGFQFDGRSRLEAGVDGIAEVMDKLMIGLGFGSGYVTQGGLYPSILKPQ